MLWVCLKKKLTVYLLNLRVYYYIKEHWTLQFSFVLFPLNICCVTRKNLYIQCGAIKGYICNIRCNMTDFLFACLWLELSKEIKSVRYINRATLDSCKSCWFNRYLFLSYITKFLSNRRVEDKDELIASGCVIFQTIQVLNPEWPKKQ